VRTDQYNHSYKRPQNQFGNKRTFEDELAGKSNFNFLDVVSKGTILFVSAMFLLAM
jgi:hypothetical protein